MDSKHQWNGNLSPATPPHLASENKPATTDSGNPQGHTVNKPTKPIKHASVDGAKNYHQVKHENVYNNINNRPGISQNRQIPCSGGSMLENSGGDAFVSHVSHLVNGYAIHVTVVHKPDDLIRKQLSVVLARQIRFRRLRALIRFIRLRGFNFR